MSLGRPLVLLGIFTTAAELFTEDGDLAYATLLAAFARDHPASQAKVKERAEKVLSDLKGQLSTEEVGKIRHHSQQSDLESLAGQLLTDLEPTL
jgi:hypothetical protein